MAQSTITRAFEAWNAKKVVDGFPAVPDQVVFALIPGQDENQAIDRSEGIPAAEYIQHRANITQAGILNSNAVVYSVVLDTQIGDWDYNWIGLVDSQTNTVLMIVHVRTQQKLKTRNGQQGNSLTRNLAMEFDGAAIATQIHVSAQTWQIDFSSRLFGMDEAHRLALQDYYGTAAFLRDGFKVSLAGDQATVAPGIGYVGGLRVYLDAPSALTVEGNTAVWLDVSRQGTVNGAWENRLVLKVAVEGWDYTDDAGYAHYVTKLADIINGQATDTRTVSPIDALNERFLTIGDAVRRYAPIHDPAFTGNPTAPTPEAASDSEQIATTHFVQRAVSGLVDSAPEAMDTLKELSQAMGDDPSFSVTMLELIGGKLSVKENGADIKDQDAFAKNTGLYPAKRSAMLLRNIMDLGGSGDCVIGDHAKATNNHNAFLAAIAERPCRVYFPRVPGNTGCYKIDGSTVADLAGVEIIADPGVSFYTPSDNPNCIIRKPGGRVNRHIRIHVGGESAFVYEISPNMGLHPTEKPMIDDIASGELHIPESLGFQTHSASAFELSGAWPNASLQVKTDGFTMTNTSVTWNSLVDNFRGVIFPAVIGDTLLGSCRDGGAYSAAIVETVNGWCLVRYVAGTQNLVVSEFDGNKTTEVSHAWPDGILPPYHLDKAVMGVHVLGARSFGVVVNGAIVLRVETLTAIVSAGWANGFNKEALCTLSDPIRLRGKVQHGLPLVKVVCLGDSTGDPAVEMQSQFDYAKHFYAGMGGGQVTDFLNLSVKGNTILNQRDSLLKTDINGFTFCLVQIGINDIQAQTPLTDFNTALDDIVTYCKASQVMPILGVPAMFYTRGDIQTVGVVTDHIGQNSGRSHLGTLYRLAVMKAAARHRIPLNYMSAESLGVVSPRLLASINADNMVMDNIHPTALASMAMGQSWARAMAAFFASEGRDALRKDVVPGYTAFTAAAARIPKRCFTAGGGGKIPQTPFYTVSDDGRQVTLSYHLSRGESDWANDVIVGTLPERIRPVTVQRFLSQGRLETVMSTGGIVNIEIDTAGKIRFLGASNDAVFMPFSVTYAI